MSLGQSLIRGFKLLCLEKFNSADVLEMAIEHKPVYIGMWPALQERFRQYVAASGADVSGVPAFAEHPSGITDPARFHNALGQTETLGAYTIGGPEFGQLLDEEHSGSFGLPVPNVEIRIVDPETGDDLETGVQGEIIVRGYLLSDGLYKLERDEAFDDHGWLHTGDQGFFRNGYLYFKGRGTEMIRFASCCYLLLIPLELGTIDPHPVKDDGKFASNCNGSASTPFCSNQMQAPCFKR